MNTNGQPVKDPDWELFNKNRSSHTLDQLAPYEGQQVAWSLDGTRILVSAADWEGLFKKMDEAGISTTQAILDYVDRFDESRL